MTKKLFTTILLIPLLLLLGAWSPRSAQHPRTPPRLRTPWVRRSRSPCRPCPTRAATSTASSSSTTATRAAISTAPRPWPPATWTGGTAWTWTPWPRNSVPNRSPRTGRSGGRWTRWASWPREPYDIAGVQMNFGAHLPPGTMSTPHLPGLQHGQDAEPDLECGPADLPARGHGQQRLCPAGLQGRTRISSPPWASQFKELPEGWKYEVVNPTGTLQMNVTPDEPIPSVKDEFDQIYMKIQASTTTISGASMPTKMPTTGFGPGGESGLRADFLLAAMAVLGLLALGAAVYERRRASKVS